MRWLLVCLSVCSVAAAVELHCAHPLCQEGKDKWGNQIFTVEGHRVRLASEAKRQLLTIYCEGWSALGSAAMPRFAPELRVSWVSLANCPMPAHNGSLAAALTALNVTLQPIEGKISIKLLRLPAEHLTLQHFSDLEYVTDLEISGKLKKTVTAAPGFLSGLQQLRELQLSNVWLPVGETQRLPGSIRKLELSSDSLNSLPAMLPQILLEIQRALPGLRDLILHPSNTVRGLCSSTIDNGKVLKSSLETLSLYDWVGPRLEPLDNCDELRKVEVYTPKIVELTDRWMAACPLLETVTFELATDLTRLPVNFLEGATALKRLAIRITALESLPVNFLAGAPNLQELDLRNNQLSGPFPSDLFYGPALLRLYLNTNVLDTSCLAALAPLTSLTDLSLDDNDLIHTPCQPNGYSPLQNLTHLKSLSLSNTGIDGICRDWRENLTFLEVLDLKRTLIAEFKSTDFLFRRDSSVKKSVVKIPDVSTVNFTKEDYETALQAGSPAVTIKFLSDWNSSRISCDCSTYWLRRAVDEKRLRIEDLTCDNEKKFTQMPLEEMCPDKISNAAA